MQDKYAGDIGDFCKFVLLRQLSAIVGEDFRLGVNWYRADLPGEVNNDGRHIDYLHPRTQLSKRIADCDPGLFESLKSIVENHRRSIASLEQAGILPSNTIYFSDPIPNTGATSLERINERARWYEKSLKGLDPANAIFLDPDNGISTQSIRNSQKSAVKYAFVSEIQKYLVRCDCVIVYQHRDRTPSEAYFRRFQSLRDEVVAGVELRVLRFRRVSVRDYVFILREPMATMIRGLFDRLTNQPFDELFQEIKVLDSSKVN